MTNTPTAVGWLVGTIIEPHPGGLPETWPASGAVTLTPMTAATNAGRIVAQKLIRRPLGPAGELVDLDGSPGVALPVGRYLVKFALLGGATYGDLIVTIGTEHTREAPADWIDGVPA